MRRYRSHSFKYHEFTKTVAMSQRRVVSLEDRIKRVRSAFQPLKNLDGDLLEMLKIIHRPGWTSVAEFTYASALLDGMFAEVESLAALRQGLLKGSRAVGPQR